MRQLLVAALLAAVTHASIPEFSYLPTEWKDASAVAVALGRPTALTQEEILILVRSIYRTMDYLPKGCGAYIHQGVVLDLGCFSEFEVSPKKLLNPPRLMAGAVYFFEHAAVRYDGINCHSAEPYSNCRDEYTVWLVADRRFVSRGLTTPEASSAFTAIGLDVSLSATTIFSASLTNIAAALPQSSLRSSSRGLGWEFWIAVIVAVVACAALVMGLVIFTAIQFNRKEAVHVHAPSVRKAVASTTIAGNPLVGGFPRPPPLSILPQPGMMGASQSTSFEIATPPAMAPPIGSSRRQSAPVGPKSPPIIIKVAGTPSAVDNWPVPQEVRMMDEFAELPE